MPVQIHGKEYKTVAERVNQLRADHPDWTIKTKLVSTENGLIVMRAAIYDADRLLATGYAEEERGSSNINQTSAVENAETSAVGRALAFLGYAGTEIASADEVAAAITQQREKQLYTQFTEHMQAVQDHLESLQAIREFLLDDNLPAALEAWRELGEDAMRALWRAPSKGGWFTTRERAQLDQAATEDHASRRNNG